MTALAPLDEWRALPPPLQRAVLARVAAEHGPAAVAALRYQVEAHRRPSQRLLELDELCDDGEPWRVLIITGEYSGGKTQLATWLTLRAIVEWRVERPRLIAANDDTIRDDLVKADAPSGLLAWLPPWIPREYSPGAAGRGGRLIIDGIEVSLISAAAGANAIGSAAGWVFFDDFAKVAKLNGAAKAEDALASAFKSLRAFPGRMLLPTTPDGAEIVQTIAAGEGMRGVVVLDLGRTEDNRALPPAALDFARGLRKLNMWNTTGGGAFAHVPWAKLRVQAREVPRLKRAIVVVDPNKSQREQACKVGIVGVGIDFRSMVYGLGNRSEVRPPEGPKGWPAQTLDLAEEIEDRHGLPRGSVELAVEMNTPGKNGPALLRAEEKLRSAARGGEAISIRKIHEVTSRPNEPKTKRAEPIVNLCGSPDGTGSQIRMVAGLGEVESSLSGLTDAGQASDEADAFVWGALILTGLDDGRAANKAAAAALARQGAREAWDGFTAAQRSMPRPAFPSNRV